MIKALAAVSLVAALALGGVRMASASSSRSGLCNVLSLTSSTAYITGEVHWNGYTWTASYGSWNRFGYAGGTAWNCWYNINYPLYAVAYWWDDYAHVANLWTQAGSNYVIASNPN